MRVEGDTVGILGPSLIDESKFVSGPLELGKSEEEDGDGDEEAEGDEEELYIVAILPGLS